MPFQYYLKGLAVVVAGMLLARACEAVELLSYTQTGYVKSNQFVRQDYPGLSEKLLSADTGDYTEITLKLSDSLSQRYRIEPIQILSDSLSLALSQTKTYRLIGIDSHSSGALDKTELGIRALVEYKGEGFFIEPETVYVRNMNDIASAQRLVDKLTFDNNMLHVHDDVEVVTPLRVPGNDDDLAIMTPHQRYFGNDKRVFRIAVAATPRFIDYMENKTNALAEIITATNRASWIFERDVAVQFQLVSGFESIFDSWRYDNGSLNAITASTVLSWVREDVPSLIDNINYDILTAFDFELTSDKVTGFANIGSSCSELVDGSIKPASAIQIGNRKRSAFYSVFMHELGHQFGATHSFHGTCSGLPGRSDLQTDLTKPIVFSNSSIERGTGSSLMSYAGLCGDSSLSVDTDEYKLFYFNARSIDQMREFLNNDVYDLGGAFSDHDSSCANIIRNENDPLFLDVGPNKVAPYNTPLYLDFSDVGNRTVYSADQYDIGGTVTWREFLTDIGAGALFRSQIEYTPRIFFPDLKQVLAGSLNPNAKYVMPTTEREINFMVTARMTEGVSQDLVTYQIVTSAGPFAIRVDKTRYTIDDPIILDWDVANTDIEPIGCSRLILSINRGQGAIDFIDFLDVPNTGSAIIANSDLPISSTYFNVQIKASCPEAGFFNTTQPFSIIDNEIKLSVPNVVDFPRNSYKSNLIVDLSAPAENDFVMTYSFYSNQEMIDWNNNELNISIEDVLTQNGQIDITKGQTQIIIPIEVFSSATDYIGVFGIDLKLEGATPNYTLDNNTVKLRIPAADILKGPNPDSNDQTSSTGGGSINLVTLYLFIIFLSLRKFYRGHRRY